MLTEEAEEIISRFIGMFDNQEDVAQGRKTFEEFLAARAAIEIGGEGHEPASTIRDGIEPDAHDPDVDYLNDIFRIERVRAQPIEADDPALALLAFQPVRPAAGEAHAPGSSFRQAEATIAYQEADIGSLNARTMQTNLLDDRDILDMSADHDPLAIIEAVAREFEAMVELANHASPVFEPFTDAASFAARLSTSAHADPASAGRGPDAPTGHEGLYVDGERVDAAPDLSAYFVEPEEDGADAVAIDFIAQSDLDPQAPHKATLDTGGNLVANDATMINVGHLAPVSVVMGNWHETNSIRQINIHGDRDEVTGASLFTQGGTFAYNVASFERIDATPEPALPPATPLLPSHYSVDLLEGDLFISNILRQVNMTLDGDQVALSSIQHDASFVTAGNETVNFFDFLAGGSFYDLVIIGGDVFEGNFIEQMNVLMDSDRVHTDWPGIGTGESDLSTGDNLLVNSASIVNYGGTSGFTDLSSSMRELVDKFASSETNGMAALGSDLAFLGSAALNVLYITGSIFEANIVSQLNVLNDADTVLFAADRIGAFMAAAGTEATWQISTGSNVASNFAGIVDVDDTAAIRFVDGEYYSDSMLLQAEIVAGEDDIATFDVNSLASELIAFTTNDEDSDEDEDAPYSGVHDAYTDGMASMLA